MHDLNITRQPFYNKANGLYSVFVGTSRYQYSQGIGDVLHGILKFIPKVAGFLKMLAMKNAQTLLKAGSEAIKECATVKDVIKFTLKPTVGAV